MKQATVLVGAFCLIVSRLVASFHLWEVNEVYSNSDGSVQFIELFTTADGQEFLGGQSLTVTGAGTAAPFTFGANVPGGATANHSLLIGTSNLEALYGLVPDYVLPVGFLTDGASSSLNFAGVDSVSLAQLPRDGSKSLNGVRNDHNPDHFAINESATPTNFAGDTLTLGALAGVEGVYRGIVKGEPFAHETSGFITLSSNSAGKFSAALIIAGKRSRLVGKLDANGSFSGTLGSGALSSTLTLQLSGNQITGTIAAAGSGAPIGFTLDRAVRVAKGQSVALTGKYGLLIPADLTQPDHPQGDGFGTARVAANGTVRAVGKLADGAPFAQSAALTENGSWPFYARLYGGKGEIVGALNFRDTPQVSDLDGTLSWFRPAITGSKRFAPGFSGQVGLIGSSYVPPGKGARALAFEDAADNGRVAIGVGNGGELIVKVVTLGTDNKVAVAQPSTDKLKVKLSVKSGIFSGSFFDVVRRKSRKFEGVLFQKQNIASGFFLGDTQSGFVTLARSDDVPDATDIEARTNVEEPAVIDVFAGITDPDAARFSIESFAQPSHGTVAFVGSVATYTPASGYEGSDSFTYTVSDGRGGTKTVTVTVTVQSAGPPIPPDPVTVAPPVDLSVATAFGDATAFLYTGANPIQSNVAPGTIEARRAAVVRAKVVARDGSPLPGVTISVLGHPEFGQTLTRADGAFDLAVNGGGQLTLRYEKNGFLAAQRAIVAPWRDYASLPDVVMVPLDTVVTPIDLAAPVMQVARGSAVSDADGARQATVLFPEGTTANLVMPDGTLQPITSLNIRATEFTIGANGPAAMPAPLPPSSGYTYCAELSADEAIAVGASEVRFSQALPVYVENFLGFPVGGAVPTGSYDRQKGQWIASANGRVIKVLSIAGGTAELDLNGDDTADDATALAALGVTTGERARLAQLYTTGQTLWRVPITHFTPWDHNWPYGPPSGATSPPGQGAGDLPLNDTSEQCGSIIGVENQTLGESVPVTGTPWRLHYKSDRTPGRKDAYTLDIPVSGPTIPTSLRTILVEVDIAGRLYRQTFPPAPNLTYTVAWDGRDGYGRPLQGAQTAVITVSFDYAPQYYGVSSAFENSFGQAAAAGSSISINRAASAIALSKTWTERVGPWDARALGLGGWSLSLHHAYDPVARTLLLGNGQQRRAAALPSIITTAAGNGVGGFSGDGGPAPAASLRTPTVVAVGPDGTLYIADYDNNRIRRVEPNGSITTVAGNGNAGFSGDGGPAVAARIRNPYGLAVGSDGSLFIADAGNHRIRRVAGNGIITTVAGTGIAGFSGDGGPATAAQLNSPHGLALSPDGSLYIADLSNVRVRRIGPDGIITTVAGISGGGFSGDGGPATAARLLFPTDVAVSSDGTLYFVDRGNQRVRRVAPDGIITTVAGTGVSGFSGDGGPAVSARLKNPDGVAVAPDGNLYIADLDNQRIRRVGPDGTITTVAGNGIGGFGGDGGPATAAQLNVPDGLALGPDGRLYIAEEGNHRIRQLGPALPGFSVADILLSSEDGREVYLFNSSGRHLKTLDALTGTPRYQFDYNSLGYLTSITDGSGNVTTIQRSGATATAIVAPGGQQTALITNAGRWLVGVNNPAVEAHTMTYSAEGLMQSFTDPRGNVHRYTYDPLGRLIKNEDPAGGSTTLVRTEQSNGYTVTTTTALGHVRAYQVERLSTGATRRSVNADCCGGNTVTVINTDGNEETTHADGSVTTGQSGPDPRWGVLAPRLRMRVRTLPGGQTETTTSTHTVSLADPSNPLSLQTLTDTVTVNGRVFTRTYDAATRTLTDTSAEGRRVVTVLDPQGRVIRQELGPGLDPITWTYDGRGRLTENRQGAQVWTYSYDAHDRIVARTDAAGRITSFLYDDADRITKKTLPSGVAYQFSYDANGNRTEVTLPSGARHALGYTPLDSDALYTPPDNGSYLRTINADKQLTRTTLPSGRSTDRSYDAAGRLTGMSYPEAITAFEYSAGDVTDRVARIANTPVTGPAQSIDYSYNGGLISGMSASGAAPAQVTYSYDNNFFLTSMNMASGTDTLQTGLIRDRDGIVTGFGPFTFTRGGPGGALSGISDASLTTIYGYDTLGRVATRNHQVNAQAAYATQLSYDNVGRIIGHTETVSGTTHTYEYTYDPDGQLVEVKRDNVVRERYAYDTNGNRTSRQLGGGAAEPAIYDSQDRLIQRGAVVYQFNADGFLTQRGADTFQYSTRGELLGATVGGQTITYRYDGLRRRVSRTDSSGTYQYLYGDSDSHLITAIRAASGELTALFYDTAGLLIALERGGARYYVATDQAGTPCAVSNSTGSPVKVLEHDSFGNVMADSNPAFDLPIGYAGGLADAASGLVHFGFRDYDPAAGRWTARDPALFAGRQGNLYAYVGNNPVNNRDPLGLICISATLYAGYGGGVQTCITSEGTSLCLEVGFGVGGGGGVDNGGLETTGTEIALEGSAKCGPASVGGNIGLDSRGCVTGGPSIAVEVGPVNLSNGGVGLNIETAKAAPDVKLDSKCAAQGKLAGKGCVQTKF